jgi:hypothetical protein
MMKPDALRVVATAFAASAMLAGCGGGGTFAPARGGTDSVRRFAAGNELLFVSDTITSDVYVYSYPQGKLAYTLTGFTDPAGECAAPNGDVFITNTGASNILEFAPNSQYPLEQLKDPGYFPVGCSVDPTTGNLAVTNFSSSSSTLGDVVIYKHAKGRPTGHYTDPNLAEPSLCGYDGAGNLFVDGQGPSSGPFAFAELPKGGTKLKDITLDQPIAFGGGVQWDGKYVAVGDQSNNTIYRFAISGRSGTKAGKTVLRGATQIFQFWIQGSKVIGADAYGGDVGKWQYPAGGRPVKVIGGLYAPLGVTVSVSSAAP